MSNDGDLVAWREGRGIVASEMLSAMGPGLSPREGAPFVPAARWSEVVAAIAVRLLRAISPLAGMQDHEREMLVHSIAAMATGGEHDEERKIMALVAQANLGIVSRFGTARPPALEGALAWFPRALEWATRRARLNRKCPYDLPSLAAEAAAHHAALASAQHADAEAARRAESEAQRRDVEAALAGREIALV
jgi:hypothetical protein